MDAQVSPQVPVAVKPVRGRWLQFSLRTLLVLTTFLCCGLGWIVPRAQRQQAVVQELIKRRGNCFYSIYKKYSDQGKEFPAWYSKVYDSPFLDYVDSIIECNTCVKNKDDITFLNQLSQLQTLKLRFQEKGIQFNLNQLLTISSLRTLQLESDDPNVHIVSPEIIADIGKLPQLKSIDLHYAGISEQGLKNIETFIFIEELHISKVQLSKLDIKILQSLPRLTRLHIEWVNGGLEKHQQLQAELQKSLPKCQVSVSGGWICG